MYYTLRIRLNQILEKWKSEGFRHVLNEIYFTRKEVVPVKKGLQSIKPYQLKKQQLNLKFIHLLNYDDQCIDLKFGLKSRQIKCVRNMEIGYKGFAAIEGNKVLGDIWYTSKKTCQKDIPHSDLPWLGIEIGENDVYLFDMYVSPSAKGGGMVNFLMGNALFHLGKEGYQNAIGYYVSDNLPAMWAHRIMGYEEMSRILIKRLLFKIKKIKKNQ